MNEKPKAIEISLPPRPALLRRLVRLLEKEGEVDTSLRLQDKVVEAYPDDWNARLSQYDMYLAAGQPGTATQRLEQAWDDALRDAHRSSLFRRLLRSKKRLRLLADFERAALARNPADVRAALGGSQALMDSGDLVGAQALLAEFAQRPAHSAIACKRLILGIRTSGHEELLDVALGGLAAGSAHQLAAWLSGHDDDDVATELLERLERSQVPGWNSVAVQLTRIARMEAAGRHDEADRAHARIESVIAVEKVPRLASPTASTLMFRNPPLLSALVAVARWYVERRGQARIHVAACSTGEEAYSLALLLDKAGILAACEIMASDFDPALVRRARTGVVGAKSMEGTAPDLLEKHFTRQADGRYRLDRDLLSKIAFHVRDLRNAPAVQHDLVIADNLLVHYPEEEAAGMLASISAHAVADGVLCLGGGLAPGLGAAVKELGWVPLLEGSEAIHEAWRTQRSAWYLNPRPYWALPPARKLDAQPWRRATLFARSEAVAETLAPLVAIAIDNVDGA